MNFYDDAAVGLLLYRSNFRFNRRELTFKCSLLTNYLLLQCILDSLIHKLVPGNKPHAESQ